MNTGIISVFKERYELLFYDIHAIHLTRRGDIKAVFVGHDHQNDFVVDFEGLKLGYGAKTGYGSYGPAPGYLFIYLFI